MSSVIMQAVMTIADWAIEFFFGDSIKAFMTSVVAMMVGATTYVFGIDNAIIQAKHNQVSMSMAKQYVQNIDEPSYRLLEYDGKAVANRYGVKLNHDSKGEPEWMLGKNCNVLSYKTKKYGKWAVGEHVWVVVFEDQQVSFTKASLPKQVSQEMKENCTILENR